MQVLCATSPQTLDRVRAAVAGSQVKLALSAQIWTQNSRALAPDVVVVETKCVGCGPTLTRVESYLERHPHVGVVLIGPLSPALVRAVQQQHTGKRYLTVALTDYDNALQLWLLLRHALLQRLPAAVVRRLEPVLANLPEELRTAVARTLADPCAGVQTVPDIARLACVTPRTLYRHLHHVGLSSPKDLIRLARVLQALPLLYQKTRPLADIYQAFGHADYRVFQQTLRRFFGGNPRELRAQGDPSLFADRVVKALLTPAA
jgi:AraC-like DNA-binding protein